MNKITVTILATLLLPFTAACQTAADRSVEQAGVVTDDGGDQTDFADWFANHGHFVTDIGDAATDISNAAGAMNLPRMAAGSAPPIPLNDVDIHWQDSLNNHFKAAVSCIDGVSTMNVDFLEEAARYTQLANASISQATSAMERYL
ncbi:MAG: hypothetical protein LC798_19125 [Chloroflexi bacterium]|nr:hypothetical protein [Chloroflexota bacterium]